MGLKLQALYASFRSRVAAGGWVETSLRPRCVGERFRVGGVGIMASVKLASGPATGQAIFVSERRWAGDCVWGGLWPRWDGRIRAATDDFRLPGGAWTWLMLVNEELAGTSRH